MVENILSNIHAQMAHEKYIITSVVYLCVMDFSSFYDLDILFWNCSDSVVLFLFCDFIVNLQTILRTRV